MLFCIRHNHAWILRVLCGALHGTDGKRVFFRNFFCVFLLWIELTRDPRIVQSFRSQTNV